MKLINVLLTILLGMTLFMVSCADEGTATDKACSSTNLNGKCDSPDEYCNAGVCELKEAVCDPECTGDQLCIEGTCSDKTKEVDCVDVAPTNGTSTVVKVTINYDETTSIWSAATDCEWQCDTGFEKNLVGTACVEVTVECTDNETRCNADNTAVETCVSNAWTATACADTETCVLDDAGVATCEAPAIECVGLSFDAITFNQDMSSYIEINGDNAIQLFFRQSSAIGTYDLASNVNNNTSTCEQCVLVYSGLLTDNDDSDDKMYFQESGSLTITEGDAITPESVGEVTAAKLVEIQIDQDTNVSTPVVGGGCIEIETGKTWGWDTMPVCGDGICNGDETLDTCPDDCDTGVPADWTCNPDYYGDGDCDCGCGVLDSDCVDSSNTSCLYNNCTNPQVPNATENWICEEPIVPVEWTCEPSYYGDGDCDCGCGVLDSDCVDSTVDSCDFVDDQGSCTNGVDDPNLIDPNQNWMCVQ